MSLSQYTLIEADTTLEVINNAIREALHGALAVQCSLTRADGAAEDAVGVVLVAYVTKENNGRTVHAKLEWVLQHGLDKTDLYLEELCGELSRQWLFNSGESKDYSGEFVALMEYIEAQKPNEPFLHLTNVCDVIAEFMTKDTGALKSDREVFPFAGWLSSKHPTLYEVLNRPHKCYGDLRVALGAWVES
jgi:hypothetical protein